jgi:regulator of sigma E protease
MLSGLITLLYFIVILGIVVFIHELGHFIFAKKAGIYVYEFSIGMGPKLFKFNRKPKKKKIKGKIVEVVDETDYCIRAFPIGGFVQMAGEEIEADEKIPKEKRLQSKTWGQRFMVMVAGVMNNFILAFVVLLIIGWTNTLSLNSTKIVSVNNNLYPELKDGDRIVNVNGAKINNYDRLNLELQVNGEKEFDLKVKHENGEYETIKIQPYAVGKDYLPKGYDYDFELKFTEEGDLVVKTSNIDELKEGMSIRDIVKIDDVEVNTYTEFLKEIKSKEDSFDLTFKSGEELKTVTITKKENKKDELAGYEYGFQVTGTEAKGFFAGIKYAVGKWISTVEQMFLTLWYLIIGKISLKMLSGPVGIYNVVGQARTLGFTTVLSLIALLNINVGFINILPLPAFDGGHALFLIIEKIKGSPVNQKVENTIHNIFFILLMILMLYVTFNDILRIF